MLRVKKACYFIRISIFLNLPFFYHLPVNSFIFTNLPVNLKPGISSTLPRTDTCSKCDEFKIKIEAIKIELYFNFIRSLNNN